ncbi:hypothetical protein QE152_g40737 [Popillia japonica]|uniref:Uncharacterized protein n=1 Tax=Popillia japonica TaxID=7064 RepID=A0AAW1HFX3_POPJA
MGIIACPFSTRFQDVLVTINGESYHTINDRRLYGSAARLYQDKIALAVRGQQEVGYSKTSAYRIKLKRNQVNFDGKRSRTQTNRGICRCGKVTEYDEYECKLRDLFPFSASLRALVEFVVISMALWEESNFDTLP